MRETIFAISLFAALLQGGFAEAQISNPTLSLSGLPTLVLQGDSSSDARPDFARLTIDLRAKAPTIEGAIEAEKTLVPRVDALLQTLKSEGVSIESSRFELGEAPVPRPVSNISQPATPPSPPSYMATTSYNLRIDKLDLLSDAVTKLATSGLVEMHTASFHVEDETVPMDEARRNAVADARRQAETITNAAGVRLDGILSISDARI
ncbi:MAG: SIMPL domain-containing protein, partial [Hyphomicrobiales bacterium]|nr:SIMPL domain-containing protein [Hyphomicrobiales bacterium]